jgi:N6-L-threonylcarbamoyladenine synthase
MIAVAGLKRLAAGQHEDLAIQARAQWPLETLSGLAAPGIPAAAHA